MYIVTFSGQIYPRLKLNWNVVSKPLGRHQLNWLVNVEVSRSFYTDIKVGAPCTEVSTLMKRTVSSRNTVLQCKNQQMHISSAHVHTSVHTWDIRAPRRFHFWHYYVIHPYHTIVYVNSSRKARNNRIMVVIFNVGHNSKGFPQNSLVNSWIIFKINNFSLVLSSTE